MNVFHLSFLGLLLFVPPTTPDPQLKFSSLRVGMKASTVVRTMGAPSWKRVRKKGAPGLVGERSRWAYGASGFGEFARHGLVLFDKHQRVSHLFSPIRADVVRSGGRSIPSVPGALRSPDGMEVRIQRIPLPGQRLRMPSSAVLGFGLRVTLHNFGKKTFRFAHDHTGILRNLIVEIFDDKQQLLSRDDLMRYHSPFGIDKAKWPVIVIPSGGRRSILLHHFWPSRFGMPALTRRYAVRVSFPFHRGRFFPSNRLTFSVSKTSR